ncbi:GyrI-like domain-containing protein [Paenibacillus marinisediminis]
MNISLVTRPEMTAAVIQTEQNGFDVRRGWRYIQTLLQDHPNRTSMDYGFVFVPEWQWVTGVNMLWVGVEVNSTDALPAGVETITIPARDYAKITVKGDRIHSERAYVALNSWFGRQGYTRDTSEGSIGFEANRLHPINPFDIPADKIQSFDYDIYAPIKR